MKRPYTKRQKEVLRYIWFERNWEAIHTNRFYCKDFTLKTEDASDRDYVETAHWYDPKYKDTFQRLCDYYDKKNLDDEYYAWESLK